MNGPIPFTDQQITEMCRMYRKGASLREISEKFGISTQAVRYRLQYRGVKLRPRGAPIGARSPLTKDRILELLKQNKTVQEVADHLSVTVRTIYRRLAA